MDDVSAFSVELQSSSSRNISSGAPPISIFFGTVLGEEEQGNGGDASTTRGESERGRNAKRTSETCA